MKSFLDDFQILLENGDTQIFHEPQHTKPYFNGKFNVEVMLFYNPNSNMYILKHVCHRYQFLQTWWGSSLFLESFIHFSTDTDHITALTYSLLLL